jgi:TonB family protein
MISLWMLYSSGMALLLGLGALAAERVCLATRRPTRWGWVTALAGSLLLPLALPGTPGRPSASAPGPFAASSGEIAPLPMIGQPTPTPLASAQGSSLDRALGLGWLLGSTLLTTGLLLSARSLGRQRRTWRHGKLAGMPVRFSTNTGPAVVGILWPEVVVPDRFSKWDEESQRLLVEHEVEHERAGDPTLLLVSLLAVVFMPWNLPLWWQARRLRFALEVDCDARVLRRQPSIQRYGRLLIEVGRVKSTGLVPIAAFSGSRSFLEQRIRILATPASRPGALVLLALVLSIVLAPVTVYSIPAPQRPDLGRLWAQTAAPEAQFAPNARRRGAAVEDPRAEIERDPTFTPYDVGPELRNRIEFGRALAESRPAMAEEARTGRAVVLWAFVDESGMVTNTRLLRSSGEASLDRAAEQALRETARFIPARERGQRVPAWIQVPVTFASQAGSEEEARSYRIPVAITPPPRPPSSNTVIADGPSATPYETRPELLDPPRFGALLMRSYPPALKKAGVGGTAVLWVFVGRSGAVKSTRLLTSSGHEELDLVAREVLRQSRFAPARNQGRPVDAWVQLPVRLQPR